MLIVLSLTYILTHIICSLSFHRSLGCTVIEMLTKHPPFIGYETMAALFKIATCDHPEYTLPEVSEYCKDFIKLCLKKDHKGRLSAEQLLTHKFVRDLT